MASRSSKSILVFCPRLGAIGGTETHIIQFTTTAAKQGWDVRLAVRDSKLPAATVKILRSVGVQYSTLPSVRFFLSLLRPTDLLYTNSTGNASPTVWQLKGRLTRGFHHVHTCASREHEQPFWTAKYRRFLEAQGCIVACSEATKANLQEAGAKGRIEFLPYITEIQPRDLRKTRQHRPASEPVHIGFIGRVEPVKGIDLIIDAARDPACKGIMWHVFGTGSSMNLLQAAAQPNIKCHGVFDGSRGLAHAHSVIDAVVLPSSHSEGMPISLIEATASGLPWVATNQGGTKEIAGSLKDLFVIPSKDRRAFIEAVCVLENRIRRDEVDHMAIRSHYQESFAPEVAVGKWLRFCDNLMQS
jgi:glycosyltransferase involved in cell wall biosynthesis